MPLHKHPPTKSMCLVRKGEKEMFMTVLMKQFGKSQFLQTVVLTDAFNLEETQICLCGHQYGPYNKWAADI